MSFQIDFPAQPRFPILAPANVSASLPVYSFAAETGLGFGRNGAGAIGFYYAGALRAQIIQGTFDLLQDTAMLRFGSGPDTILQRDGAADTLGLRRGTNAQTFRVYNTYTDASNYERARFSWVSNWLEIGTSAGGTGVARSIVLMPATNIVAIGGTTSSFPALLRSGADLYAYKADGSGRTDFYALGLSASSDVTAAGRVHAYTGTAIPAGGTAGVGVRVSSTTNFGVFFGSGAPTLSAAKGSLYLRTDGSGTGNRMYVNTDGSTTWTAVTTAT